MSPLRFEPGGDAQVGHPHVGPSATGPDAHGLCTAWAQAKAVMVTIVWSGVVSLIAYKLVDMVIGLRVTEEEEREGLDITAHGETAYHN